MEHLAGVMGRVSCVVVTTPQAVALTDAQKSVSFARTVGLTIRGLIENMSGYVCPCCGEVSRVFSTGGGEELARREGIPFLGCLPVDAELAAVLDGGGVSGYGNTPSSKLFTAIVEKMITYK
jgi:Mrp family chromosome partitioning ATPase